MLHDKFICSLFLQGRCFECGPDNERCALMGYRAVEYFPRIQLEKRQNVKFYFDTARVAPFCRKFIHMYPFCTECVTDLDKPNLIKFANGDTV